MKKINSRGLFIADPHFMDNSIPNRKDSFIDAISLKFQEALEIARDRELQYVVILGDLFHSPDPPGQVRNRIIEILLRGNNSKRWPFEIFLVAGNHDVYGHTIKTIEKTAIKTLESVGLLQICDNSEKYGIHFGHYEHDIEKVNVNVDFPILAMHSNITPDFFYNAVTVEDFQTNDKNKLVVSGHYHPGYDLIEKTPGLFFANPGSLGRISSSDAKHEPKVLVVELKQGEIDNIEYVSLQKAQPSSLIFDLDAIANNKAHKIDITDFIKSIDVAQATITSDSDIISNIKHFGVKIKMEQEVIDEAVKRVSNINPDEKEEDDNE